MTIFDAFGDYILEQIPASAEVSVTVQSSEIAVAEVIVEGTDYKARCVANAIHQMLRRCADVTMGGYEVALAYSTKYEPEKLAENKYTLPIDIQYSEVGG